MIESAVTTAWASALVTTPSTTGRPPKLRRPAQGDRVQYPTVRDHAPTALTRSIGPISKASSVSILTASDPRLWKPTWTTRPLSGRQSRAGSAHPAARRSPQRPLDQPLTGPRPDRRRAEHRRWSGDPERLRGRRRRPAPRGLHS